MFATIQLSPYIHVQGLVVRRLPGGAVAIDLGGREIVGPPLGSPKPVVASASRSDHA